MLYELLYPLKEYFFIFNVFKYITFRAFGAAITSLLICFFIGPKIIRTLNFRQIGEKIHTGPLTHQNKEGTPTMGGVIILLAIILPSILWCRIDNIYFQLAVFSTALLGIIGFFDDYLKVIKSYPKGLIARYKIFGQIFCGGVIAFIIMYANPHIYIFDIEKSLIPYSSISLPFIADGYIDLGWGLYIPLVILIITGTSNAVNLSDGLDGLASGLVAISTITLSTLAYASGNIDLSNYLNIIYIPNSGELFIFGLTVAGACIGFLWHNAYPAKVFMGDTGSLSLGAALGCIAICIKKEFLLIIIGGVFVMQALSVIFQILYYKYTKYRFGKGKRLFRMAPLHHHYELSGLHENQVVIRLWIIGILLALLSLTTLKIQ